MNRSSKRAAWRETKKIQNEFWNLVQSFEKYITDFPDERLANSMITKKHNAIWIQFCNQYSGNAKPDPFAFVNFVTGKRLQFETNRKMESNGNL